MEFAILGPLEVRGDGGPVSIRGPQQRALLAALLVNANEPVSAERLAAAVWGEESGRETLNTVRVNISRLRGALGADGHVLETTTTGYRLRVGAEELDATRFARM